MLGTVTRQNVRQPFALRLTAAIFFVGADRLHDRISSRPRTACRTKAVTGDQAGPGEDELNPMAS